MAKRSSTTTPSSVSVATPKAAEKTVSATTDATKSVPAKVAAVKTVPATTVAAKTVPTTTAAVKTVPTTTVAAKSLPTTTVAAKTAAAPVTTVAATSVPAAAAPTVAAAKTDTEKPAPAQVAALATAVQSAILFPVLPSSDAATIRSRELVFTLDGWKSLQVLRSSEAPQAFSESQVLLDGVPPGTPVEFALRLELAGHSIWLNNGGRNYRQLSA